MMNRQVFFTNSHRDILLALLSCSVCPVLVFRLIQVAQFSERGIEIRHEEKALVGMNSGKHCSREH